MAEINNFVRVVIRLQTGGVSRAGFGVTLIAGYHTLFSDRQKPIAGIDELDDLGGDALHGTLNGLIYNAAAKAFTQSPRPETVMIGRINANEILLTVTEFVEGREYTTTLDGIDYSYTAVALDTVDIIATVLAALLTAVAGFTSAFVASGVYSLAVDVPGTAFTLTTGDTQTAALDPGGTQEAWVTGLAAIQNESDQFYAVAATTRTNADQQLIAGWVEANDSVEFYRPASADVNIIDQTPAVDLTSLPAILKGLNYDRSSVIYHSKATGDLLDEFIDVAWSVMALGFDPDVESATDKFKTLRGITPDVLTAAQRANAIGTEAAPTSGKNANVYTVAGGVAITQSGITASGEWNDIIFGADWLKVRMEERIFAALVNNPKLPYTDAGIAAIVSEMRGQLQRGIETGFLAFDAELDETFGYAVEFPKVANVDSADKANRILKQLKFFATAAGAIHAAKPINGTLSA